jgi:pimeloyl-ACP methyl ester carboxylesterase
MLHNLIAGSKLEIVPGAGHFAHRDKPDEVLQLTQEFLDK